MPTWVQYASIPVIAGIIGYVTNRIAVWMTFRPLDFVGIPPYLGWQGIIPMKSKRMASISVDTILGKLGTLTEIVQQMGPDKIRDHLVSSFLPRVPGLVDEIVRDSGYGDVWRQLPAAMQEAVYERVRRKLPRAMDGLTADMTEHMDDLLDLRFMVVDLLSEDRELLNRMFLEAGEEEFRFIVNSGLVFGFFLGLVQMGLQIVFGGWWILPLAGVGIGWATNWLALKIIFNPVEPVQVGPWQVQGLFLKRQEEVAVVFARLVTREILTLRNFADRLMNGPRSDRTRALVRAHVQPMVDDAIGLARPAVQLAVGSRRYAEVKDELSVQAMELGDLAFDDPVFNAERAVAVEHEMRARMVELSPEEFQDLLRPAFQEDESKLILAGAVLGGLAGLAQTVFVF